MSLVQLPVRIAAMEALIEHGFSYRRVAELYGVARGSLLTWHRQHQAGAPTLDQLRAKLPPSAQPTLDSLRVLRDGAKKNRRGSAHEAPQLPATDRPPITIVLLGTVDGLVGARGHVLLSSNLIINDDEGVVEKDTEFAIHVSMAKQLRIDDHLKVTIEITRDQED